MHHRTVLITGAASGIGQSTARSFSEAGDYIIAVDRDEQQLRALAAELADSGAGIETHTIDVSDLATIERLFADLSERLGRVDCLVNNAALIGGALDLLDVSIEDFSLAFTVNVAAPLRMIQLFAKAAIARGGGGKIVNISSSSAFRASATRVAYGATKGALNVVTRVAAAQLGAHNINVNAIAPGLTNTPAALRGGTLEQLQEKVADGPNSNFFKRLTEPEEVAQLILFLCSEASRQITGQVIQISAGTVTV